MPFTPFHWSVVILGLTFFEMFYIPALAISSVIMDIEPFYYLFIAQSDYIHRVFHTYLGATIIGIVVGFILIKLRKKIDKQMTLYNMNQKMSEGKIYFSSIFAAWSHIFLDSFMHADMKPFWPITDYNPFLGLVDMITTYIITGFVLFIVTKKTLELIWKS